MKDIVGAVAVLDNLGGTLHLQTFYPLFIVNGDSKAEYDYGLTTNIVTVRGNGSTWTQSVPKNG